MTTPTSPDSPALASDEFTLPEHCIISAQGKDVKDVIKLLQGQCTGDFNPLLNGRSVLAAHCSPKGRMLSSFVAAQIGNDAVGLRVHKSIAEQAIAALHKYAVFFRVKLALTAMPITCQLTGDSFDAGSFKQAGAGIELQHSAGLIETWHQQAPATGQGDTNFWEYQQIRRGLAEVTAATYEQYLPQAFNFDLVDGINFKKGCYTGQEIIARVHYKGQSKQRLHCLTSEVPASLGQSVLDTNGKACGEVVRSATWEGQHWLLATSGAHSSDEPLFLEAGKPALTREALPYAIP